MPVHVLCSIARRRFHQSAGLDIFLLLSCLIKCLWAKSLYFFWFPCLSRWFARSLAVGSVNLQGEMCSHMPPCFVGSLYCKKVRLCLLTVALVVRFLLAYWRRYLYILVCVHACVLSSVFSAMQCQFRLVLWVERVSLSSDSVNHQTIWLLLTDCRHGDCLR